MKNLSLAELVNLPDSFFCIFYVMVVPLDTNKGTSEFFGCRACRSRTEKRIKDNIARIG